MQDLRAELIPPEILGLFDDRFVRSCRLADEHTFRLALALARGGGLAAPSAAGREPMRSWLGALLAGRGVGVPVPGAVPDLDPQEVVEEQRANDPACLPTFALAEAAAAAWPAVLRGASGEDALFGPGASAPWPAYFSNDNPLYAVANALAARAAARFAPGARDVLELGGGLGSAAAALVGALDAEGGARGRPLNYVFTELVPPFLRRGQRALAALPAVSAGRVRIAAARLDIDAPFAAQGVADESADVVFAVNTLHVARDLAATLTEIRSALRGGGWLVLGECLRPAPGAPLSTEFPFLLLEAYRRRGFLTADEWRAALRAAGFEDVTLYPDVPRLQQAFPLFVAGAIGARRP